jgi:hypothetical protein
MFCPKCGTADQSADTFCRRCGTFLPDFDKIKAKETPPEQHFLANSVLSVMTATASLALAILLYAFFLGKEGTSPLIYITAGFLTAMFFWQAQVFWRNLLLKKRFEKRKNQSGETAESPVDSFEAAPTNDLLKEANFEDFAPASVTEKTTNKLGEKISRRSS